MDIRTDFPIFEAHPDLVYLDSAATTQKPRVVIDAVTKVYTHYTANIHRGMYPLATEATSLYEEARKTVAAFIGASSEREIIFTRSATEALNLLAATLSPSWKSGQNIVLSEVEHHANLVPWQQIAKRQGLALRFAEVNEEGRLNLEHLTTLIDDQTVAVSVTHCSNVLGTITPAHAIKKILQKQGSTAHVILDASQSIPHFPLTVRDLGCDFLVFSGHKLYAPSGTGVLWGREALLEVLPPYQTGGDMIRTVSLNESTWNDLPWKFEAGTPNIEGIIGLGAAIQYLTLQEMSRISQHTAEVSHYLQRELQHISQITILGTPDPQSGIVSFTTNNLHPHDLATLLGEQNICIRAGHHCAAPLHQRFAIPASSRVSLGIYSTKADIDYFLTSLTKLIKEVDRV